MGLDIHFYKASSRYPILHLRKYYPMMAWAEKMQPDMDNFTVVDLTKERLQALQKILDDVVLKNTGNEYGFSEQHNAFIRLYAFVNKQLDMFDFNTDSLMMIPNW